MAPLRLTPANLKSVKRTLRSGLPNVKSTHLTETVAAALGFRTHASLLAAVERAGPGSEPIAYFDAARATERLFELSCIAPVDGMTAAVAKLTELPDPCWLHTRSDDSVKQNDWFYECKRLRLPYVVVKIGRKYATLEWDCVTVDVNRDESVRGDNSRQFVRELFSIFQQHCVVETGRPIFEGSAFVGSIERLLSETACVLAGEFFARLYCAARAKSIDVAA